MDTKNQTILIIEQAPIEHEVFRTIIGKDYQLLFAAERTDVLELVGQKNIDLVMLDIDTPGLEAGDIFTHLNANPANCNTEIILIVKKGQEDYLGDLPSGVTDVIAKPLQPQIVIARLQSRLEIKRYRDLGQNGQVGAGRVGADGQWKFDFLLAREWVRALRSQTPISLIYIDIDFFQEFETLQGRQVTENCLRLIGEVLRECAKRDLDYIASIKTHAFVCLLPDTDAGGARQVCQLIKEKVAALNIPHPCSPLAERLTLSIGVATVRPTFKLDPNYLLHQAEGGTSHVPQSPST